MIIDSVKNTMFVPADRKKAITQLISEALYYRKSCNYHTLERITGCLNSMHWAFGNVVSTMTRSIYSLMNKTPLSQMRVELTSTCIAEQFWLESFDIFNGHRPIWKRNDPPFIITTDASGNNPRNNGAWAAWTYIHGQIAIARGAWLRETDKDASAYLELETIHNAILSFQRIKILSERRVRVRTDSQNVFYVITNSRSKSDKLHMLFKQVYWLCFRNQIELEAEWIPREQNEFADWYSKLVEPHDVQLNPIIFHSLQRAYCRLFFLAEVDGPIPKQSEDKQTLDCPHMGYNRHLTGFLAHSRAIRDPSSHSRLHVLTYLISHRCQALHPGRGQPTSSFYSSLPPS
jgi:ribonuclease HI